MIKKSFFIAFIIISSFTFGQKSQRIAYIDMEYILENVPEYTEAQAQLDKKVTVWQQKLDELSNEIESLNTSLINEKALLTNEMILEREEDIDIKKQELKRLQLAYFGTNGDMYMLRKQMVTPVQDQVFNAIQAIAARKKYDFVLDKSSDLIMLYSNSKYDISEQVLNTIVKNRKRKALDDKKKSRVSKTETTKVPVIDNAEVVSPVIDEDEPEVKDEVLTDEETGTVVDPEEAKRLEEQRKKEEKEAKRAALKARIKAQQEARQKLRDSLKKVAEERRAAKLKEIEDRQKEREKLKENNN
ncbi:MAG: OmpH family outer membrane protein [Bacteroidota bacterium]